MPKYKGIIFMFCIMLVTALACNFPSITPTPSTEVDATLTSLAITEVGQNSSAGLPTFPVNTATVTLTPTITLTSPPTTPMASVSVDTNCRTGPGVNYDYLTGLLVGEKAEVIGKYTSVSPTYWIIKKGTVTCWLWGQYASVEGETSNLPEMVPPPSPTPPPTDTPTITPTATSTTAPSGPDFSFSFEGIVNCSPGDNYAALKWDNTGSVVFESAKVEIRDLDTSSGLFGPSFSDVPFVSASPGCGVGNSSLGVGNTAYSAYYIGTTSSSGNNIRITVTMCSQDAMLGDCVTHTLDSILP